MCLEGLREVALVVESAGHCHLPDRYGRLIEHAPREQQPSAEHVVARAHAEQTTKFALQVADGETACASQFRDADRPVVFAGHHLQGRREATVFVGRFAGMHKWPQNAREPGDPPRRIDKWELGASVPGGQSGVIGHEPGLFPHRPARPHDAFVLSNILRRQRRRVEVVVVSPHDISHRLAAVHGEEGAIHPRKSAAAVLYEENDVGQGVEERERLFSFGRGERRLRHALLIQTSRNGSQSLAQPWRGVPCSRAWFIFDFLASSDRPAVKVKWYDGGPAAVRNFPDYAGPLTETILLGNLAVWAADTADVAGKKIEWDAKKLVATNAPEVEPLIRPTPREGWKV